MLIDARSVEADAELRCDVCVVGAGPAGITIADRLRGIGLNICLVESGGFEMDLQTQRLGRGEIVGHPYYPLHSCRFRLFGGSSNRWGGWCRPLDPLDYSERDWLPESGWPIDAQTLQPYHEQVAALLQLPAARFDYADWRERLPAPLPLDDDGFEPALVLYSPPTNFGERYRERLRAAADVTLLLHGTVTELLLDREGGSVETVRVRSRGRPGFAVRARAVVLATGAIENARLLLCSCRDRPAGLGNEHDLVGRFFMEHLHVPAGHLLPSDGARGRAFYDKRRYGDAVIRGFLAPTADAQTRERLLACFFHVEPPSYFFGTAYLGWPPELMLTPIRIYRELRRTRARPLIDEVRETTENLYGIHRKLATLRAARRAARSERTASRPLYSLYAHGEQAPDRESRVTLGDEHDALGMPRVRLDWRVNSCDTQSVLDWLRVLDGSVRRRGLGRVLMPADGWQAGVIGGPHQMGTTRMATDPRHGVVDADCRVHSLRNLYLAGSSVFATGGAWNPTFTLLCLALRLADLLQTQLN